MRTRFTELLGCDLPIQLAAMGAVGTTALAAEVARAGGLGMVRNSVEPPAESGPGALGINFTRPERAEPDAVAAAAARVRMVEFFYGDPRRDLVQIVHAQGALAAWVVGSVEEAVAAAKAGCDLVVAQGIEAGGHVRGVTPLLELIPAVLDAVRIPVVAAGGIASAETVAEVLLGLGADGVRIGTRFLATPECDAHPDYVRMVLAARGPHDTVVTSHFDETWPDAPHRVLRSALEAAERSGRRTVAPPSRATAGSVEDAALYAGTGVGDVMEIKPAFDVMRELISLL